MSETIIKVHQSELLLETTMSGRVRCLGKFERVLNTICSEKQSLPKATDAQ